MIINITKSDMFMVDPAIRFSKEWNVPRDAWNKLWKRYKFLEYQNRVLREYIFITYGRYIGDSSMTRWLFRGEVYLIAKPLIEKGVVHVNTSIFNKYESQVINELVKPLKYGANNKSKSIL